jgi:hypothetical protein
MGAQPPSPPLRGVASPELCGNGLEGAHSARKPTMMASSSIRMSPPHSTPPPLAQALQPLGPSVISCFSRGCRDFMAAPPFRPDQAPDPSSSPDAAKERSFRCSANLYPTLPLNFSAASGSGPIRLLPKPTLVTFQNQFL